MLRSFSLRVFAPTTRALAVAPRIGCPCPLLNRKVTEVGLLPRQQTTRKMSDIKKVFTAEACPPAGPYTQAIIAGPHIFVSGQIPADKEGNLVTGSIATQTEACCKNVIAILKEAGSDITRVIKTTVFLDDMANFGEMNGVYEKFFAHKPARSCVAVKQLPKGVPVEIECIALAGEGSKL